MQTSDDVLRLIDKYEGGGVCSHCCVGASMPVAGALSTSCAFPSTRQYGDMSGFGGVWLRVLEQAIDAGRSLLRDLDDREIPASLTRVAASQGGRLPPPLATRLLGEIDRNEWLRQRVAEEFTGDELDPSWLFVNRPDGWWVELAAAAEAARAAEAERRIGELEDRLASLDAQRAKAMRRARDFRTAAADAEKRLKQLAAEIRARDVGNAAGDEARIADLEAELAEVGTALESLRVEHHELQIAFDSLRSRFTKMRRTRSVDAPDGAGASFVPRDPIKLARMLDLQAGAFGRDLTEPLRGVSTAPSLRLSAGVRPDSSDAIRWLLSLEQPVVVIVDGYNAQFHMNPAAFMSGETRRRLIDALKRLRAAATVPHRMVVVYDSTLPGEREARTAVGGVEVRFAEDDRIADEEIIDAAAELDQVVVISSDRAVRDGSEEHGAVGLWSEALVAWLARS